MPNAWRRGRRAPARVLRRAFGGATLFFAASLLSAAARAPADAPLADAAMRRDTAKVRSLLKQGADVNAAQGDGMTALHWAAELGTAGEVRMLVSAGARLDAQTRNGNYTPLHLGARAGNAATVKALLEAGADANVVTTSGGATALHFASAQGSTDAVLALLEHGAKVDARDGAWSETPLMWAAAYDRLGAVRALIAHGADVKAVSRVENVPAREAAERTAQALRNRKVAALKAAEQPPVTAGRGGPAGVPGGRGGGGYGEPPRNVASGDSGAARVQASAYPATDTSKAGARPMAADSLSSGGARGGAGGGGGRAGGAGGGRGGRGGAADRGLSYGDLVGNKGGLTPLLFAARQGNVASVVALLDAGAPIGQVSAGDHTSPLLMAVINGHFDLARMLLERGASPNQASDAGATPLYAAINVQWSAKSLYPQPTAYLQQKTTYLELMRELLQLGADPNVRLKKHLWYMSYNFDLLGVNTTGATPFWRAAYGTDVPAMRLLVAYGADPAIPTQKPAGRQRGDDAPAEEDSTSRDPSGLPPIPVGGPGVYPLHAASGVGYGEGYAANSHRHAPDGWLPAVKYLVEELHADVNARDFNGYNAIHHAAARGDNQLIQYLVSKGGDVKALSRRGQTTADMANGPVQRIPPFLDTVALLEKLGSTNSHKCKSC